MSATDIGNRPANTNLPKVIAFDLDGTIALSKTPITDEMAGTLVELTKYTKLSIVSGSAFDQMKLQVIDMVVENMDEATGEARLSLDLTIFSNFILFPNNGEAMYLWNVHKKSFEQEYENLLLKTEKEEIISAFDEIFDTYQLARSTQYGPAIEDRGGQITFSALGQNAPLELKNPWDPDQAKRTAMKAILDPKLPRFDISIGGATSIDVTRKGNNKAAAIQKLLDLLSLTPSDILYFGDALFPGGNDSIVKETGVECVQVKNPQETLKRLRDILMEYKDKAKAGSSK